MLIVNVDKIELFKKILQFKVFQECYSSEFEFQDDIGTVVDLGYLKAINKENEKVCIFLFNKPSDETMNSIINSKIIVFYNPDSFNRTKNQLIIIRELSNEFFELYNSQLNNEFSIFKNDNILIRLFSPNPSTHDTLYKYYSSNIDSNRKKRVDSGELSFVNPILFNDPFDCDYEDLITGNNKNLFRVLCLTSKFDNILMWSYYGNDHKGFCYGYDKNDILNNLEKMYSGICFIGKILYDIKRPKYKVTKRMSAVDTIIFLIKVLFTKYEGWSHEDEYRIVILNDDNLNDTQLSGLAGSSNYFTIKSTILSKYYGCNSSNPLKLNKNNIDYKLD